MNLFGSILKSTVRTVATVVVFLIMFLIVVPVTLYGVYVGHALIHDYRSVQRVKSVIAALHSYYQANQRFPNVAELYRLYPQTKAIDGFGYSSDNASNFGFVYQIERQGWSFAIGDRVLSALGGYTGTYSVTSCNTFDICRSSELKRVGDYDIPTRASYQASNTPSHNLKMFTGSRIDFTPNIGGRITFYNITYDSQYFKARTIQGAEGNEFKSLEAIGTGNTEVSYTVSGCSDEWSPQCGASEITMLVEIEASPSVIK